MHGYGSPFWHHIIALPASVTACCMLPGGPVPRRKLLEAWNAAHWQEREAYITKMQEQHINALQHAIVQHEHEVLAHARCNASLQLRACGPSMRKRGQALHDCNQCERWQSRRSSGCCSA